MAVAARVLPMSGVGPVHGHVARRPVRGASPTRWRQKRRQGAVAFHPGYRGAWLVLLVVLAMSSGGRAAHAHVKWFAAYDLTKAPLPIGEVLDGLFLKFF